MIKQRVVLMMGLGLPALASAKLPAMEIDEACLGTVAQEEKSLMSRAASGLGGMVGGAARSMGRGATVAASAPAPQRMGSMNSRPKRKSARSVAPLSAAAEMAEDAAPMPALMPVENEAALVDDGGLIDMRVDAPGPKVAFGGTVHLSNDDALSLASPQRLLYALERSLPTPLEHIRPHEFLNYFSFDLPGVARDDAFGVGWSAIQEDDGLTMSVVLQGREVDRDAMDLTWVVDRSGSMGSGNRMSLTHQSLRTMADNLSQGDRVDVVLFDDRSCAAVRNYVSGRDSVSDLQRVISQIQPRGGTDLNQGLSMGYGLAEAHAASGERAGQVMVFTDAMLNTGDVSLATTERIGASLDKHGIRLSGVGVGDDFRDDVLDALTEKGKGAYLFLGSEAVVDRFFGAGLNSLLTPLAEDLKVSMQLPDSLGMQRFYGEQISTVASEVQPVTFASGGSQVFFQDLAIAPEGLKASDEIELVLSWKEPGSGKVRSQVVRKRAVELLRADATPVFKARALMSFSDALLAKEMGGACDAPASAFDRARKGAPGDGELAWLADLMPRSCEMVSGAEPGEAVPTDALQVSVDADVPVGQVTLRCADGEQSRSLSAVQPSAAFRQKTGRCEIKVQGPVPLVTHVDLDEDDTRVTCRVRGGRVACR